MYDPLEMILGFLLSWLILGGRGISLKKYATLFCHPLFWARLRWLWSHAFSTSQETLGHGSRSQILCLAHGVSWTTWQRADSCTGQQTPAFLDGCRLPGRGHWSLIAQAWTAAQETPRPEEAPQTLVGGQDFTLALASDC